MTPSLPETIGKFRILQSIGEGGMGRLYLGRDPDLGSLVVIKLLREGFDNPEMRERFAREARAARGLRHGNIVTIFEAGTHSGQPFIVMEYIQGETLAHLIQSGAPLPLERKLQLMDELGAGLEHAHRKGVVHRDIKPANLMIDEDGVLRILDFGIARHGTTAITRAGAVMGTYNYIAPEQLAGEVVDGRADVFAAGAVFYELLSYRRAFPGEPPAILRRIFLDNPEPLEHLCAGLDPEIMAIVNRCLAKRPADRYADFGAFRAALAAARRRLSVHDTSAGAVGFDELLRMRSEQIKQHLETAQQAYDTANYSAALQACQRLLLLDPEHPEARELTERARTALERRKLIRQCLQEAATELDRGAVSAASALADRALAYDPLSEDALAFRRRVDDAIRHRSLEERSRRVADALDSGRKALDGASLEAAQASVDQALALDPENEDAHTLLNEIATAFEARRLADQERAGARNRIDEALRNVAAGDFRTAYNLLEGLPPTIVLPQPLAWLKSALFEIGQRSEDVDARRPDVEQRQAETTPVRHDATTGPSDAETHLVGAHELDAALETVRALLASNSASETTDADRQDAGESHLHPIPDSIAGAAAAPEWRALVQEHWAKAVPAALAILLALMVWGAMYSLSIPVVEPAAPPSAAAPERPAAPRSGVSPANTTPQLSELRTSARAQWQRAQTEAALVTLTAALRLQPRDSQTLALADEFLRQAEAQSSRGERSARELGVAHTARFSRATTRAREAARLARTGQKAEAIRAYLDAVTLFVDAASEPRSTPAARN
jgi:hypothetical protein